MRFKTAVAILLACGLTGFAQEHMADELRKGIVAEDTSQNLGAAISQYQAVITQYTEARQTAATALFRMAECYRKEGNRSAAIAAYQRVVKEFADQPKLADESRITLRTTYQVAPAGSPDAGDRGDKAKFDKLIAAQNQVQAKTDEARARYRATIEEEMALTEKQIAAANIDNKAGPGNPFIVDLEDKLIHLKRDLAAFDAGMASPPTR